MVKLRDNSGHADNLPEGNFPLRFQEERGERQIPGRAFSLPILNSPLVE
jgi:hypothetical protein